MTVGCRSPSYAEPFKTRLAHVSEEEEAKRSTDKKAHEAKEQKVVPNKNHSTMLADVRAIIEHGRNFLTDMDTDLRERCYDELEFLVVEQCEDDTDAFMWNQSEDEHLPSPLHSEPTSRQKE